MNPKLQASLVFLILVFILAATQMGAAVPAASAPGDKPAQNSTALETRMQSVEREVKSTGAKADLYQAALSTQTALFSLIVTGLFATVGLLSWLSFRIEVAKTKRDLTASVSQLKEQFATAQAEVASIKSKMSGVGSNLYQIISEHQEEKGNLAEAFRFSLISASTRYEYLRSSSDASTRVAALESLNRSLALVGKVASSDSDKAALNASNYGVLEALSRLEAGREEDVKDICAEIRLKLRGLIPKP